jgi:hypothetical protein
MQLKALGIYQILSADAGRFARRSLAAGDGV